MRKLRRQKKEIKLTGNVNFNVVGSRRVLLSKIGSVMAPEHLAGERKRIRCLGDLLGGI